MNTAEATRPMTTEEVRILETRLDTFPRNNIARRDLLIMILYSAGVLAVFGTLAWQLLAWILRNTLELEYGWSHPRSGLIFWGIVLTSFVYIVVTFVRAGRPAAGLREKLLEDLRRRKVKVEELSLVEAKLLEEPEHGGRIYFLRTDDDRVYVTYDRDCQDLGAGGEKPVDSKFSPRAVLSLSVAPSAGILLDERFSGEPLPVPTPVTMTAGPEDWPEDGAFIDIPWREVESRFAA